MLPEDTKVEMVAINKETGQVFKKIVELQEFKNTKKKAKFNYYLYQIGYSQYKNTIEI